MSFSFPPVYLNESGAERKLPLLTGTVYAGVENRTGRLVAVKIEPYVYRVQGVERQDPTPKLLTRPAYFGQDWEGPWYPGARGERDSRVERRGRHASVSSRARADKTGRARADLSRSSPCCDCETDTSRECTGVSMFLSPVLS